MRALVAAAVLSIAALALAQEPAPPTRASATAAGEWRWPRLRPLDPLYRQTDLDRQNVGANGRKNATRDEQRIAETPSLQPRPLSSF